MKFRALKIRGFKGFADPADLPIRDGLSGIVGPNGCGKSNLVEAIGWVMGENRPSAVRSGAMEDVIFSGSATRPAGSSAEVQLVIDNSDRTAPPGFNDDAELVIARRIDRDLGSSFIANGRDVRWRDLQLLFADSATGARSSALISQGRTNDIINSKPSARKGILEDAAGTGGLHRRRHEAELKLTATTQNLERVNDVLGQLGGQITSLKRQAAQAKRYRRLAEDLRNAKARLLYILWYQAASHAQEAELLKSRRATETAKLQAAVLRTTRKRDELSARLEPLRTEATSSEAAVQRIRAESELIQSREASAQQALMQLHQQIKNIKAGIGRENDLYNDAVEHCNRLVQVRQDLIAQDGDFATAHEQISSELSELADALKSREQELDNANRQMAEINSEHNGVDARMGRARTSKVECEKRERDARRAVNAAEAQLAHASLNIKNASGRLSDAETQAAQAEALLQESETIHMQTRTQLAETQKWLSEAESQLGALRTEQRELSRLVRDDASDSVHLLNHVRVDEGFEAAFGAAFGDDAFAPVNVSGTQTGWHDVTPDANLPTLPSELEPLADHVDVPPFLERRISQVGLAEASQLAEIMDALKPGQRAVTRNGDLVRWDGFMVCGQETPERTTLRLRQLNRLERLASEIAVSEQKKNAAAERHNQLTAAFTEINKADQDARASRRQAEEALALANSRLSAAEAESDIAEKTLHSLKEARKRAVVEAEAARDAFAIAEQAIHQLRDVRGIRSEAARLKELVVNARDQKLHMQSQIIALERAHDEREAKLADAVTEISNWEQRQEQAAQRIADLTGQHERLQRDLPQAEARPGKLATRRIALVDEILMAEEKRAAATDRLRRAENEARLAVHEASQADSDCARSLELKGRADADCANASVKLQETVSAIQNEMNCSPDALGKKLSLDPHSLPDAELQEIEVNRLQRSRDAIGAVNLMAEQDIVELQEEMDALQREKEDLEAAVNRLWQTIRGLNSEGRERLLTAFETVNTNFRQLFSELFNGGSARLELVEGDDPLDTGLEILCHPPGKRFSTISLLSGGEQTLTAVALIFAFFMANPAPICVLDEVDAPLDDSNVMKFCSMMEKIVQRTGTRFLVITHNPITMSHMDRLYGVTMQEKGVSKMVSVDLTEAEKLAA